MESAIQDKLEAPCVVRLPQPGDYERMADLAHQLGYPCSKEDVQRRIETMLDPERYGMYVAESPSHGIVGWIGVHVFRAIELDACVEISGLVVDQDWRSRGVGKLLLDAAEEWARHRGYKAISVLSNVIRERAHQFYTSNGFEHLKTQKAMRKLL